MYFMGNGFRSLFHVLMYRLLSHGNSGIIIHLPALKISHKSQFLFYINFLFMNFFRVITQIFGIVLCP